MSENRGTLICFLMWLCLIPFTLAADVATQPDNRSHAVIAGTIYESDGLTLTIGQGGKDWKVVFLNSDGENEQPSKIEYLGSTYRAEFDMRKLRSPVVTMCLYDGPDKLDCAMERMVLSVKTPIHLDVAFWPKQAK